MENQDFPSLAQIKTIPAQDAIPLLNRYLLLHPKDEEAYILRGMKYWSCNKRKEAIMDYISAININPDSKAKMALQYAYSILDYYNKDLLNP
ncbi:MAG: hypothetical protein J1F12_02510 [Muribaculaceae bacterium]|nr:hypothetical protein [Muribaculaceae bacterium]